MRPRVAVIHNHPDDASKYADAGETKALIGVVEAAKAVQGSLSSLGYPVQVVPLAPPMDRALELLRRLDCEVVFNLFEGFEGRPETEAEVAYALADFGYPFTGCRGATLTLALDKGRAKRTLADGGIRTPAHQLLTAETISTFSLRYPCIVKPSREDASHGVTADSVVCNSVSLDRQVRRVCGIYGSEAVVEEFVEGREFNVTVLGNDTPEVLPVSEIIYSLPASLPKILTFEAKWEPESLYFQHTKAVCPADISPQLERDIRDIASSVFRIFDLRGYARVDLRLDVLGRPTVLEVNPNPDISTGTGAARQAVASGLTYDEFISKLVSLAFYPVPS